MFALPAVAAAATITLANEAAYAQTTPRSGAYAVHVAEASQRFGIPENWIEAVMHVESGGNPRALSRAGAMGLMQIMPATWAMLTTRLDLGGDPFDIRANIQAGAAYLRHLWDRYGSVSAMLAAYNAGPSRADAWVARGTPLPAETASYIARIASVMGGGNAVPDIAHGEPAPVSWRNASIFAAQAGRDLKPVRIAVDQPIASVSADNAYAQTLALRQPSPSLFVPLSGAGRP